MSKYPVHHYRPKVHAPAPAPVAEADESDAALGLDGLDLERQRFSQKDDIKPWLLKCLKPRNVFLVIERSDKNKIIFKCKNSRRKHQHPCPFKLRANYLIRNKIWLLSVINDQHDHGDVYDDRKHKAHDDEAKRVTDSLYKDISGQISAQVLNNKDLSENEKHTVIKELLRRLLDDQGDDKMWQPHANLIPLSPLLNDNDADLTSSSSHTVDQLPVLNQFPPQAQQLPSFNSIQNQLPLLPNMLNTSTPLLFSGGTLLSNTTLNPSHLLKSSKSTNTVNLNDFKLLLAVHGPYFPLTGLSSPNNNLITSNPKDHQHGLNLGLGDLW